jgi:hypothetical protein
MSLLLSVISTGPASDMATSGALELSPACSPLAVESSADRFMAASCRARSSSIETRRARASSGSRFGSTPKSYAPPPPPTAAAAADAAAAAANPLPPSPSPVKIDELHVETRSW